jgi:hypothetical protein
LSGPNGGGCTQVWLYFFFFFLRFSESKNKTISSKQKDHKKIANSEKVQKTNVKKSPEKNPKKNPEKNPQKNIDKDAEMVKTLDQYMVHADYFGHKKKTKNR